MVVGFSGEGRRGDMKEVVEGSICISICVGVECF